MAVTQEQYKKILNGEIENWTLMCNSRSDCPHLDIHYTEDFVNQDEAEQSFYNLRNKYITSATKVIETEDVPFALVTNEVILTLVYNGRNLI
jgi:hypothetical protein